ncbi:MAG: hypothetical protein ACE5GH_02825 [Fidelibacterota bacterium]
MKQPFARRLGETLAHIQDLLDRLIQVVLQRTREASDRSRKHKVARTSGVAGLLKFFSEVGDSFFSKYSEIKSKDRSDGPGMGSDG